MLDMTVKILNSKLAKVKQKKQYDNIGYDRHVRRLENSRKKQKHAIGSAELSKTSFLSYDFTELRSKLDVEMRNSIDEIGTMWSYADEKPQQDI